MAFLGVIGGGGKGSENVPTRPDNTVSETLMESGWVDEAKAIVKSVEVAKGKYIEKGTLTSLASTAKNGFLGMALAGTIALDKVKNYIGLTQGSARDFFKGLFESEHKEAETLGMESETIASEAGIWGLEVPLANKPSVEEATKKVQNGIEAYVKKTDANLQKIFDQNRVSKNLNFKYEERLEPRNIKTWLRVVGQYREQDSQESVKEISSQIKNGVVQKRDKLKVSDAFEIVVCKNVREAINARNFTQIAEDQPVVKIIMVTKTDEMGNEYVDTIETWQPHFTMNGSQGVDFLTHITEDQDLTTEDRDIKKTQVLRNKTLTSKEGEELPIYDISVDYDTGIAEKALKKLGVEALEPRMKETVLQMAGWLALTREKSGYVCIDPLNDAVSNTKPTQEGKRKPPPAELQLAFITTGPELDDIYDRAKGRLTHKTKGEQEYINLLREMIGVGNETTPTSNLAVGRAMESLKTTNENAQDEFARSEQGRGTIATLSAHLPELARTFFKYIYKSEDKLVSQGSIQLSKIKAPRLKGVRFRSALNLHTDANAAEIQSGDKIHNNFRTRTDPRQFIRTKSRLQAGKPSDMHTSKAEVEELLVIDTRKHIAEQRKMQVILAIMMISRSPKKETRDVAKAIKLGLQAFQEIDEDLKLI